MLYIFQILTEHMVFFSITEIRRDGNCVRDCWHKATNLRNFWSSVKGTWCFIHSTHRVARYGFLWFNHTLKLKSSGSEIEWIFLNSNWVTVTKHSCSCRNVLKLGIIWFSGTFHEKNNLSKRFWILGIKNFFLIFL